MADSNKDLLGLHYLRGICAVGVMIFHYTGSAFGRYRAEDFFGKFGVYAVSIFYILSGITLFHVYFYNWDNSKRSIGQFYLKRILRIFPLLWISSILVILIQQLRPPLSDSLLYFSGLFSFLKWDFSINPVAWSIGNELFFYSLFPLVVWITRKSRWWLAIYVLIFAAVYLYFAFWRSSPALSLPEQWRVYTNPLNQYFLFLSGFVIALLSGRMHIGNRSGFALLGILIAVFAVMPFRGDPGTIITGYPRVLFTVISIGICALALQLKLRGSGPLHRIFYRLGNLSYAVYMLHPVVWMFFDDFYDPIVAGSGLELSITMRICISIGTTSVLSALSYRYLEMPFMGLAKMKAIQQAR